MADHGQDVLVVGGGVSGLLSALFSAQRGADSSRVLLFEAEGSLCGAGGRAPLHRLAACERFVEDPGAVLKELHVESAGTSPVEVLRALTEAVTKSKIEVYTNCAITRLLYSDGQCCGCVYRDRTNEEIRVQGKVILCCGGFLSDVDPCSSLLAGHRPDLLHWPLPLGLGSGGCGALLRHVVERCGAKAVDLDRCRIFATSEASAKHARRLLPRSLRGHLMCPDGEVQQGHRSEDEIATEIVERGPCWLIRSDAHPAAPRGSLRRVELKALEKEMQVPRSRLVEVLRGEGLTPSEDQEFFVWVARVTPALLCCEGGLAVAGDSGAVLAQDDRPIPGLFAAGEAAASSGSSLSSCVASALRAAAGAVAACPVARPCDASDAEAAAITVTQMTQTATARTSPKSAAKLHQRLAVSRLETFLKNHLTAETLQKALFRSLKLGRFDSAIEELVSELSGWSANEALSLQLRDPVSNLGTRPMLAALPEVPGVPANSQAFTTCVHCRLPLKFQVTAEVGSKATQVNGQDNSTASPETNGKGFAYATLLYGKGVEYFLGALVLGWSLQANGCQEARLLLYTEDVPEVFLDALQIYWTLHKVEYLHGHRSLYLDKDKSRFQAVFTKIQVLSCTDYSKVLMMDLDMLVRGNLDELFQLRAPAALKRCSGREQPEHGGDYVSEDFYKAQADDMRGGMNAGVMLLEPDMAIYQRMCREIEDPWHPEHLGSYTPEQDYLGRFYGAFACGKWTHLHAKFNYQPNLPDNYVGSAHKAIDVLRDVMVAHYSGGRVKPWKIPWLKMDVTGVRRLLEEDLEDQMGRSEWQPKVPRPSTVMMMDGVLVDVAPKDSNELPEDVRQLMWEWVLALRQCNQQLLEDGVDLLSLIDTAEKAGRL